MNQWKEPINICAITETALSRFFPAIFNPDSPTGERIICSTEQSKLCFEALEMNSVPQNNLPLQGA